MSFSAFTNHPLISAFSKNSNWFLAWGIALLSLGILAISFTTFTTLLSVVVLGFLIFSSGIVILIDTFTFWLRKWKGFFPHLIIGLLYTSAGLMLLYGPMEGAISLTLLLGVLYTLAGVFRVVYSLSTKLPRWKWSFFNGLLNLVLGVLILSQWPASSLFIIGLFVGIDLLFSGWAYIMAGIAGRSFAK
jgi:uncharacterized membrane protein HdeD (DUF308 family)